MRVRDRAILLALPLVLAGLAAAAACPSPVEGTRLSSSRLEAAFKPIPGTIEIGRLFSLDVEACSLSGGAVPILSGVDADMPEHRHGMNYAPTITPLGGGRFRADGLMFHMPGHWRLLFDFSGERIEHSLVVE